MRRLLCFLSLFFAVAAFASNVVFSTPKPRGSAEADYIGRVASLRGITGDGEKVVYFEADFPLRAPIDIADKALVFSAWSSTPKECGAVYVRGYNKRGECILSYMNWSTPLDSAPRQFMLELGRDSMNFKWEPDMVKHSGDTTLAQLRFYIGNKGAARKLIDMSVAGVKLVDLPKLLPSAAFTDLGVGARSSELRSLVVGEDNVGRRYVLTRPQDSGKRGYLLYTEVDTGETIQYYNPSGVRQGDNFGSVLSRAGVFYYDQINGEVLAFDVNTRETVHLGRPDPDTVHYIVYTEGDDGTIFMGGYPASTLVGYNPKTGEFTRYGKLDNSEKYVHQLACDDAGWVYCGLGSVLSQIVAVNPATGEKRNLLRDDQRGHGYGLVRRCADGRVYGSYGDIKLKLYDGKIESEVTELPPEQPNFAPKYGERRNQWSDGSRVMNYNLYKRSMTLIGADASERELSFDYTPGGLGFTSLGVAAGKLYGSTSHPMHFIEVDPMSGNIRDFGPHPTVGGGNFCNITGTDTEVYGCQYAAGHMWRFDADRPWDNQYKSPTANPVILGRWRDLVTRPREIQLSPSGATAVMAGFANYGLTGGGFGIHNIADGENREIAEWLPGHSCVTFRFISEEVIVGGTSIEAPGGGRITVPCAELFKLDLKSGEVLAHTPIEGATYIASVELFNGMLYAVDNRRRIWRADTDNMEVAYIGTVDSGMIPRNAFQLAPDGNSLALLTERAIYLLSAEYATIPVKIAEPPAPVHTGGGRIGNYLYYCSLTNVYRLDMEYIR